MPRTRYAYCYECRRRRFRYVQALRLLLGPLNTHGPDQ